jgi:hypothetical protein
MKAPPSARHPIVELEYLYVQLVEYARDWAWSRSRWKRQPSGILKDLVPPKPIEGAVVGQNYKPPSGEPWRPFRKPGPHDRPGRFFRHPNQVAAAIAAECISDWRGTADSESKRRGPYKVQCADGSTSTMRAAAARFAVKLVNERYGPLLPPNNRRAKFDHVMNLLERNRGKWPSDG